MCVCVCVCVLTVVLFVLQESDNLWWDAFATEFFEEDATLTLSFCLEDGPKRYSKSAPPRCFTLMFHTPLSKVRDYADQGYTEGSR